MEVTGLLSETAITEAMWEGRAVKMFTEDLRQRAVAINIRELNDVRWGVCDIKVERRTHPQQNDKSLSVHIRKASGRCAANAHLDRCGIARP
jgi:hypothetical protein